MYKGKYVVKKGIDKELQSGISIYSALSFLLFIYAPLEMYFTNKGEFWFGLSKLLLVCIMLFVVFEFIFAGLLYLLDKINKNLCIAFTYFGLFIYACMYIHGTFLAKYTPELTGNNVNGDTYRLENELSLIVIACIVVLFVFLVRNVKKDILIKVIKIFSMYVSAVLLVSIIAVGIKYNGAETKKSMIVLDSDILKMSSDTNYIILLLDCVDGQCFEELLDENPQYKECFKDFTFYRNTMGGYPYTKLSVPMIFSGRFIESDDTVEGYIVSGLENSAVFKELEQKNYDMNMYMDELTYSDFLIDKFDNIYRDTGKVSSYFSFAKEEAKLVFYRYMPFALKRFFVTYNANFNYFEKSPISDGNIFLSANKEFYEMIKEQSFEITDTKQFKYIHLMGGHRPFMYDENFNVIEERNNKEGYMGNMKACMTIVGNYLDKLKADDLYDNSVIIIMSDHGGAMNGELDRKNPILFIKGVGEKHEYAVSDAPVSFVDMPEIFIRLLDGKQSDEVSDYKEGEVRTRQWM